jgi:outer membrane protein assembly factor BamD (BamD/ComL family)
MILWRTTISGGSILTGSGMSKYRWILLLFILLLFFQPRLLHATQIILNSDDQFRYAEDLMKRQDYIAAVTELERFIHFFPEDQRVPRAKLLIGVSYLNARQYEQARKALDNVYKAYPDKIEGGKALFMIGESFYRQGVYEEADYYFKRILETFSYPELRDAALYRLGWNQMQLEHWRAAADAFKEIKPTSSLYPSAEELSVKSIDGETLPYKDPTAAGMMAAALPGLGHAYCGRYKDGMVALLLNGLFIWAAIEAFNSDQNVLGGILVFAEAGWYGGNIYSAVNSTYKYNRKIKEDYLQSLPDRLNLNLLADRKGCLGLAMKIEF